jgi:hypothetical protein
MRTLFREKLFVIFALGSLLSYGAASAATLREIIKQNGRDYVLNNFATVASQIDDWDKYEYFNPSCTAFQRDRGRWGWRAGDFLTGLGWPLEGELRC